MRLLLKNKKGAFELSMTTVVVIVLAMVMLVLGLTLVRKIMTMGTGIIDITDAGVRSKLNKVLGEEGRDITIGLPDKTATSSPGGGLFNAPLVVNTEAMDVEPADLRYKVEVTEIGDCGKEKAEDYFKIPVDEDLEFDEWEAGVAYASIQMQVPKGAKLCSQKVSVLVNDAAGTNLGKTSYTLNVAKVGLF